MNRLQDIFSWFMSLGKSSWKNSIDEASTMVIASKCNMPELSGLDYPLINRLIVQLLVGEKDFSIEARLYRRNFIRLIDKAIEEYNNAREVLLEQIKTGGQGIYVITFTNQIENCLNAVRRLYLLLDRIKAEKKSPAIPKETRRMLETQSKSIKSIRDAVEHIDSVIRKGEIAPGKPVMLVANKAEDGVIVADHEIKFKELALILKNMNELAQYILTIKKINLSTTV